MVEMKQNLVSIVTPVYNAEKYLADAIRSVQSQTYDNWELILVNDCSTDSSAEVAQKFIDKDSRISLIEMKENSGAALSRNAGIYAANGRYLAFLDADDMWLEAKLEKQVAFMRKNDYIFTFTGYEFADHLGTPSGKKVFAPISITYSEALSRSAISTITVMIDTERIDKSSIYMPNYPIGEDTAVWWRLLRKYGTAFSIPDILAHYRRGENKTLSSNKLMAMRWRWYLYTKHEKLSLVSSFRNYLHYLKYALERRV